MITFAKKNKTMIRTIITSLNTDLHLLIPKDYIGKKVEVLLFSVDEATEEPAEKKKTMADFWGILSADSAKELHQVVKQSRNEWERDI